MILSRKNSSNALRFSWWIFKWLRKSQTRTDLWRWKPRIVVQRFRSTWWALVCHDRWFTIPGERHREEDYQKRIETWPKSGRLGDRYWPLAPCIFDHGRDLGVYFAWARSSAKNQKETSDCGKWRTANHHPLIIPLCNLENGRSERIRTSDPMHPMHVRYQAAPRSDFHNLYESSECNSTGLRCLCENYLWSSLSTHALTMLLFQHDAAPKYAQ